MDENGRKWRQSERNEMAVKNERKEEDERDVKNETENGLIPEKNTNTPVLPPCGCNVFDRDFGIDSEKSVSYFLMLICLIFNTVFTLFKTQKNTWHVVGPFRARGLKNGQKGPI
jgi:hypothetical protein